MHKLLEQQLRQWVGDQADALPKQLVDAIDETYRQAEADMERLRRETRQARELEAIGRVAGGIAHDYNNLLTVIKGYCDLCKRLAPEDTPLGGGLVQISQATERAADMTRQLLSLSRRRKPEDADWDLHRIVGDMQSTLKRLLDGDQRLELELNATDAVTRCDRGRLQQLLLNTVIQAQDGLGAGGVIHLSTETLAGPGTVTYRPQPRDGRLLLLRTRAECADPPAGRSRGPAVLDALAQELGGGLRIEDGEPYIIDVVLPLKADAAPKNHTAPAPGGSDLALGADQTRILVVEDEEPVRFMLEALLTDQGHRVTLSPGPKDALERFGERGDGFDLLITDIVMPDMYGPEMAERMRQARPDLPVLFISGYDPAARERRGAPAPGGAFLQKPFDASTLDQKIREVLSAP